LSEAHASTVLEGALATVEVARLAMHVSGVFSRSFVLLQKKPRGIQLGIQSRGTRLRPRFFRENVTEFTVETPHNLVKGSQRDALLTLFQAMKCRGRQPDLLGKLGEGHSTAFLSKK